MKITKRDFNFFALGLFVFFILQNLYDYNGSVYSFIEGFRDGFAHAKIK